VFIDIHWVGVNMTEDTQTETTVVEETKLDEQVVTDEKSPKAAKPRSSRNRRKAGKKQHVPVGLIAVRQDSGIMEASFSTEGGIFVVTNTDGKNRISWMDSGHPESEISAQPGIIREDDPNRVKIGKILIKHLRDFFGRVNNVVYDVSIVGETTEVDDPPADEDGETADQL
jgi:hypothetical protein